MQPSHCLGLIEKLERFGSVNSGVASNRRHLATVFAVVGTIIVSTGPVSASFAVFDVPGADWTEAASINSSGAVAGYANYWPQTPFIRTPDGAIVEFSVPGTPSASANAINDNGSVAGWGCDVGDVCEGFLRRSDGETETFNPDPSVIVTVLGINNKDEVLGWSQSHTFIREPDGTYTNISIHVGRRPGTTLGSGLNDKSAVTGRVYRRLRHQEPKYAPLGFLFEHDGTVTTFEGPNSSSWTTPCCINKKGWITGTYTDPTTGKSLGLIRAPDGTMTSFDIPGGTDIVVTGMNERGLIVGSATEESRSRGFVRHLSGKIVSFDAQDDGGNTYPYAINSNGEIAGGYIDAAGRIHGFVGTP